MKRLLTALAVALAPLAAAAHVSITTGPGFANTSQDITFGIGHGCAGADTYKVRVEIPAGFTGVRALPSEFGRPTVEKDAAGLVVAVTWQKADADLLDADDDFYKLTIRGKVPNSPFTTVFFPTHQTCKAKDGALTTTDWIGTTGGGTEEPAPALKVLPARTGGWNKFTVPAALATADLATYFADALIVWKGPAAWSANAATTALIAGTPEVTALTELAANDEIWVKY